MQGELDLTFRGLPGRTCRVRWGSGALERLEAEIEADPPGAPLVLVSDSRVAPLHARPLLERLRGRGLRAELLVFPAGEEHKTRETKAALEDRLPGLGAGRDAALVAVGGGVTGDLAGFVAATWTRGIPVVQVPTSLLAMVDAALGGKTAVNLPDAKNLVGAFHQPWGVYADPRTLATLPDGELRDGFAEAVKTAVVADAALFRMLEGTADALLARDTGALTEVVGRCLAIKGRVTSRDERESGRRAALNFGHTIGHALEAVAGGSLSHGRAVAIGLAVESRIAVREASFPAAHARRLARLLDRFGLPRVPPSDLAPERVLAAARLDKKNRSGAVHCSLPARIGRVAGPPGGPPGSPLPLPEARLAEALRATAAGEEID